MENKVNLFDSVKVTQLRALKDHVLVCDMQFDSRLSSSGIWIPSQDKKLEGIHPRWARVYAVGSEQQDIQTGKYVLVAHGRWTRGIEIEDSEGPKTIRRIDPKDILLVSDTPVIDETIGQGL